MEFSHPEDGKGRRWVDKELSGLRALRHDKDKLRGRKSRQLPASCKGLGNVFIMPTHTVVRCRDQRTSEHN